jgi:hypothetical protein
VRIAAAESLAFEEHPALFVTSAVIMLVVLWQILWPRDAASFGRFPAGRLGVVRSAKLLVAAISLISAASERVLLSVATGACAIALIAWEAWWWRERRARRD